MTVLVDRHEVLGGGAGEVRRLLRLRERPRPLDAAQRQVHAVLVLGHPAQRPLPPAVVLVDHGAPDRLLHLERLLGPALGADPLGDALELPRALRGQVGVGIVRRGIELDQVRPVALAVREAPGHVPVASHDDHRGPRKGDPRDGLLLAAVLPDERGAVPDVGHRDLQMHVVGQQRGAALRVRARDRPVVAAEDEVGIGNRIEVGRGVRHDRPLFATMVRRLRRVLPPPVDHLRAGDGRTRQRLTDDRRVPLGRPVRGQEREQGGRQDVVHDPEGALALHQVGLKRHVHRECYQDRILGLPGLRVQPERQVFERRRPQGGEAGVHAFGVGRDELMLFRRRLLPDPLGDGPEAMDANLAVELEGGRSHQLRDLAGRTAALQVHLEEALLPVQEAEGPRHVSPGGAGHARHAVGVAFDAHGSGQPLEGLLALELGEARAHAARQPESAGGHGKERDAKDDDRDTADATASDLSHAGPAWPPLPPPCAPLRHRRDSGARRA